MGKAFYCDRCKGYQNGKSKEYHVPTKTRTSEKYCETSVDLCRACEIEFTEWWKQGHNKRINNNE